MSRRIYFVIPDVAHARRMVDEREQAGVPGSNLHLLGNGNAEPAEAGVRPGPRDMKKY